MQDKLRYSILLAAAPHSAETIAAALGPSFDISHAKSLAQAKRMLEQRHDMIVCGLYFDESRMFDLLRYAKAEENTRHLPFLAVKATDGALSATLQQSIEIACAALGADRFVELTQWEATEGTTQARARLQALAKRLLDS